MTPERIKAIAIEIVGPVADAATGWAPTAGEDEIITAAQKAISAALDEEACRTGTGPRSINNPEFIRRTPDE